MSAEAAPAPTLEQILANMGKWRASDLFVCEGKVPAVRLHGEVVDLELAVTTADDMRRFLQEHLGPELLQRFEREGDLDVGYSLAGGDRFRLNLARQQGRIGLVARALPEVDFGFAQLGLPPGVGELAKCPNGLVLVTGATGAGKSTTLAAMVHWINQNRSAHIVTIEEPIEFVHRDHKGRVTQREVGSDTMSFTAALRQVLRESPDVIMIGELRDEQSVRVALQASLSGHLVLASMHTVDTVQTLQRIAGYFPEHQRAELALDLSMSLQGVVAQRLLPTPNRDARVPAIELLTVGPAARSLIREQRTAALADLMRGSNDPSVVSFDNALVALLGAGTVDLETARAHATNPDELSLLARGMRTGVAALRGPEDASASAIDLDALLRITLESDASDLHLSVGRPPILRVRGQLQELAQPAMTAADLRVLLYSIMTAEQRGHYELERELDFSLALASGRRFRVNVYYERGNMAAAFRAIPEAIPDPEELGLPEVVVSLGDEPHGLLLVVGPTGAGKTTTLACLVDRINAARACHMITIEDPIEYSHSSRAATVHQREVGPDTRSFAAALRYILRQDPDVILIGELRDLETISAALTAAETGHLVMATLHTNDAVQTIDRMVDVFPPHQQSQARAQLAACLLGVVSQRLLPRADGNGRIAAFEVMVATTAMRTLIRENKMHQALSAIQAGASAGMTSLDASLVELVRTGQVSREEALRYMRNPAQLGPK